MILSQNSLKNIPKGEIEIPDSRIFLLPEKILQFGTGVLLRGLPDYFVDKANKKGIFNGRIVIIKSTETGNSTAFQRQDGLYTQIVKGIYEGQQLNETIINASISRVLSAAHEWDSVLKCASNKETGIIISNTTEVGIELVADNIFAKPPVSFPGKLLSFLYERFMAFGGDPDSGVVIVPTELISENATKLKSIVLQLATQNGLNEGFINWLKTANAFCNSLVDRIVPGKPANEIKNEIEKQLGYTDELLIMSESYGLWAIEGDERVKKALSFYKADAGVKIETDINIYRELKLRLLNGVHTLSSGIAFLCGIKTVKDAMNLDWMRDYIQHLMLDELAPAIPYNVSPEDAKAFGMRVLDRFRNPSIEHEWITITLQYSSKMKLRNIPLLINHYRKFGKVPPLFARGFAAYLLFMKPVKKESNQYYGERNGEFYPIRDDKAERFYEGWQHHTPDEMVDLILGDRDLWGEDLAALDGFSQTVKKEFLHMIGYGVRESIRLFEIKFEK